MVRSAVDLKSITRLALSWLVLLAFVCSAFGSISTSDRGPAHMAGLVFCPLQKKWVKEGDAGMAAPAVPLSDICAPRRGKVMFVAGLVRAATLQVSVDEKVDLTALFFAFRAKGDRAFARIPSAPDEPKTPTTVLHRTSMAAGFNRSSFVAVPAEEFSFEQLSRPPTEPVLTYLYFPRIADLRSIEYPIDPRGPPNA